ncbi:hypothetical protein BDB00DRAFT_874471 [Zychaea mexicana]|uniref:uncharacterized protein n=1 Tax=Zychaea mexicana TaxID=64656 RepID=UPI0022FDF34D|nr:uncharacterized protein BDB00DRAFT_874471 [Zychaea mexicana]KAI9491240.1 hypothetical protein BDB00DRAFT_874471 [Zychaea mexicana]
MASMARKFQNIIALGACSTTETSAEHDADLFGPEFCQKVHDEARNWNHHRVIVNANSNGSNSNYNNRGGFRGQWRNHGEPGFSIADPEYGFPLQFSPKNGWLRGPSLTYVTGERRSPGSSSIQELLLNKQAIEEIPYHQMHVQSYLFPLRQHNKVRAVLNCSQLNDYIQYEHFKMEGLPTLRHMKTYQARRLMFGVAHAPRLFTKIMVKLLAPLRKQGLKLTFHISASIEQRTSTPTWPPFKDPSGTIGISKRKRFRAGLLQHRSTRFRTLATTRTSDVNQLARELGAVLHALQSHQQTWRKEIVQIRSDSVTTCALINKQGSISINIFIS